MPPGFWLSHHFDHELDRTFRVGSVHLCARCLGTYPILLLALGVQGLLRAPLQHGADGIITVGLLIPALADWAYGRFRPHAGSNGWRLLTGALLGLALGRSLYVHLQQPFPLELWVQVALVCSVGVPVWRLTQRRRRGGGSSRAEVR